MSAPTLTIRPALASEPEPTAQPQSPRAPQTQHGSPRVASEVPTTFTASARDQIKTGEPIYLTATELARQLHVDDKTIYRWAQQEPSMPVLRIRGVVRFPREKVLRWLAEHEQGQARPRRSVSA